MLSPNFNFPPQSREDLISLCFLFMPARALHSALSLGLFEELEKRTASSDEISQRLELNPQATRHLLGFLQAIDLVHEKDSQFYLSPLSKKHLCQGSEHSIGSAIKNAEHLSYPLWSRLSEMIKTGKNQKEALAFELGGFQSSMSVLAHDFALALDQEINWQEVSNFCDLGGGNGSVCRQLLQLRPDVQYKVVDLPKVKESFDRLNPDNQIQFIAQDVFESIPPKADCYCMHNFLRSFSSKKRQALFQSLANILPQQGYLVIRDPFLPHDPKDNFFSYLQALNIQLHSADSEAYSVEQLMTELRCSGFSQLKHIKRKAVDFVTAQR